MREIAVQVGSEIIGNSLLTSVRDEDHKAFCMSENAIAMNIATNSLKYYLALLIAPTMLPCLDSLTNTKKSFQTISYLIILKKLKPANLLAL